ncbi:type II toxin-antitoxin system RelE family toxin [Candidatus Trichorickettsia mobilis]|uniref:type II toxin-antitoxin system RelE family toxin n=1 Tax=Candidatus Trichorickettsia mobilis TaxID=1346319 RepID=UPI002931288F|nr:type II toxin-antitoxin system RelE/ParE family toxin [Candidatus Trichorickettsia mobilis]
MTYKLIFLPSAQKEWNKLAHDIRNQFKKKLVERLKKPDIPKDKLAGMPECYKIKLRASGYRLVYRIIKNMLIVEVIAIGTRANEEVYDIANTRLTERD